MSDSEGETGTSSSSETTGDDNWNSLLEKLRSNDPDVTEVALGGDVPVAGEERYALNDAKAGDVACVLRSNTCVEKLDLSVGSLTCRGAQGLASFVRDGPTLKTLHLSTGASSRLSQEEVSQEAQPSSQAGEEYAQAQRSQEVLHLMLLAAGDSSSIKNVVLKGAFLGFRGRGLAHLLRKTETVKTLCLFFDERNTHSKAQATAAGMALQRNATVETLQMTGGNCPLFDSLLLHANGHPTLTSLTMESSWSPYLCPFVESSSFLMKLVLRLCGLNETERLQSLVNALVRSRSMKTLTMKERFLARTSCSILKTLFQRNSQLESFDLSGSEVGEGGISEIAQGLHRNTSILLLRLSSMQLNADAEVQALRDLLRRNRHLRKLSIDENRFGEAGMRIIAQALPNRCLLTFLSLSACALGNGGVRVLCEGLRENTTVEMLFIGFNGITFEGLGHVVNMLGLNSTIRILRMPGNLINVGEGHSIVPVGETLATMLRNNTSLIKLDLRYCSLSNADISQVFNALRVNNTLDRIDLIGIVPCNEGTIRELGSCLPDIKGLKILAFSPPDEMTLDTVTHLMRGFKQNKSVEMIESLEFDGPWSVELNVYLARNRLIPFVQKVSREDERTQGARLMKLWPYLLEHTGRVWRDPSSQASITHILLCERPVLLVQETGALKRGQGES